ISLPADRPTWRHRRESLPRYVRAEPVARFRAQGHSFPSFDQPENIGLFVQEFEFSIRDPEASAVQSERSGFYAFAHERKRHQVCEAQADAVALHGGVTLRLIVNVGRKTKRRG